MSSTADASGMWTGLNPGHVGLVARFASKFALRTGGGLVFLLLMVLTGLSVAGILITSVENLLERESVQRMGREAGEKLTTSRAIELITEQEMFRDTVQWMSGTNSQEADYLLKENPALLSVFFLILLALFPSLACFGAFNQTSGDIQNRGLRYLLLRTERANIFLGRFAGTVAFSLIYTAVLIAVLLLYIGFKLQIYPAGALISWGLQGLVALFFISLPYIALCAWMSAAIDSPFGSLVLCLLITDLSWVLIKMFCTVAHLDASVGLRFLPWGWKYELLSGDPGRRLLAIGVILGFTALCLLLGLRTFHKRDL